MSLGGFPGDNGGNWQPELTELEPLGELVEAGFEPQTRARSNTWPCPRPADFIEPEDAGSKKNSNQNLASTGAPPLPSSIISSAKKNSARRNAWGNLSYADLITQAISSSPDNRLTLSQIYEWMVQNVAYFKDKGDSNSSAGWKNSIRHNLSLHNRFMRVQNEGTGKSSWWMINPDAKPGKSVRRRATSMETSKYEKRRGRVKKKVEALRNGMAPDTTPSPSSSVSESLDMFPDSPVHSAGGFQLSPDFRQRASSNASSCGRLSPISSILPVEPDWVNEYTSPDYTEYLPAPQADQLAGYLADTVKLHANDPFLNTYTSSGPTIGQQYTYPYCMHSYPDTNSQDQFLRPAPPTQPVTSGTTTVMGQIMGALHSGALEDLNVHLDHALDCNVEEVLNHELSVGEDLDFNFVPQQPEQEYTTVTPSGTNNVTNTPTSPSNYATTTTTSPSWVH